MTGTLLSSTGKISRPELQLIPTPAATASHKPIPHDEIVQALVETLGSDISQSSKTNTPSPRTACGCSAYWTSKPA